MTTLAAGTSTTISLAVGQSLFFSPDGNGLAVLSGGQKAGEQYKIGPSPVEIGPFSQVQAVSVSAVAPVGYFILPIDAANDLPAWPVTVDAAGNVSDPRIQAAVSGAGKTVIAQRVANGPVAASAATSNTNQLVTSSQVPFYAVRVRYTHLGGSGAVAGMKMAVAASDDVGNRDYSSLTAAAFKKCIVPYKAGTAYNAIAAVGSPGWKAVTWAGSATLAIADPGANKYASVVSDIIYERGMIDANGVYPLLLRVFAGTGAITLVDLHNGSNMPWEGACTGTNWTTDILKQHLISIARSGDNVTLPSTFSEGNTPGQASRLDNVTFEFFTSDRVISVHIVGDSRIDVSYEFPTTKAYRGLANLLHNSFSRAGQPAAILHGGWSGGNSSEYQPLAMPYLSGGTQSEWLIYLVYTGNDGFTLNDSVMTIALSRAAEIVEAARAKGMKILLLPGFPKNSGGYTGSELENYNVIRAYCASVANITFDPVAEYGAANGTWARFNTDSNHMTDAGYLDLADKLRALIVAAS